MSGTSAAASDEAWVAQTLVLGCLTMLFAAALFAWTYLRLSSPVWPPSGCERLPLGVALAGVGPLGVAALAGSGSSRGRRFVSIASSGVFLAAQMWLLATAHARGWTLRASGVAGATFTGLVLVHAAAVLAVVGWAVVAPSQSGWPRFLSFLGAVAAVMAVALCAP